MLIRNVMLKSRELTTLQSDMSVKEALDSIEQKGFLSLPVVENNIFKGSISIYYIYRKYYEKNQEEREQFLKSKVGDYIMKDYIPLSAEDHIEEASIAFSVTNIPFIPVINEHKELIGIVSQKAIFDAMNTFLGYKRGTRLVVQVYEFKGVLAKISKILSKNEASIISVAINDLEVMNLREIVIRYEDGNKGKIEADLLEAGIKIMRNE